MPSVRTTRSITRLKADAETGGGLRRTLSATHLVALGIGAIIGVGIFVITGWAAARWVRFS